MYSERMSCLAEKSKLQRLSFDPDMVFWEAERNCMKERNMHIIRPPKKIRASI